MSNDAKCKFCDEPATASGYTMPPLCDKHMDMVIMIGFLSERDQPITVDSLTDLLAKCRANGGDLALEAEDIPVLLPEMLKEA